MKCLQLPAPPSRGDGDGGGGATHVPAAYLAVFDGHNGGGTARAARARLHGFVQQRLAEMCGGGGGGEGPTEPADAAAAAALSSALPMALERAFADFDRWLPRRPPTSDSARSGMPSASLMQKYVETRKWERVRS